MLAVVTILLQDYFHREVFRTLIGEKQWSRFRSRLDRNVDDTLRMLDEFGVKATFFTLGWIKDKFPALISRLADEVNEISSAGYFSRAITEMTPEQFREDIRRARSAQGNRKIALFHTGRKHAGENMSDVLRKRDADRGPPIQMCDALSRNIPQGVQSHPGQLSVSCPPEVHRRCRGVPGGMSFRA